MRSRALIASALLLGGPLIGLLAAAQDVSRDGAPEAAESPDDDASALPYPGSALPDDPTKGLVLAQCNICHGLAWIERSGADEAGWTDRIRRMIRAGAQIPPEQVPLMAAYLAKALPERPRPPPPAKHTRHSNSTNR